MAVLSRCLALLLPVASASTCGPLAIGQTFMAGSQDPTSGSTAWALTSHGISEKLFTVDQQGDVVPQVAKSVSRLGEKQWQIKLKSGYKFSDGTAVTAQEVAKGMNQIDSANSGSARASAGQLTWSATDAETLTLGAERETPVIDSVLAEWCFVVFKNDTVASGSTVFTGPFAVSSFDAGVQIELVPNSHYPDSELRQALKIKKFSGGEAVSAALEGGELDLAFHLPATRLQTVRDAGLTVKSFEVGYHYMMWHNVRRSPLSDLGVRQAVDKALDRTQLTQTLLGGDPTRSLFPANTPWHRTDASGEIHADKSAAEALLDAAGWTLDASTGKRAKDGADLALKVVAYPQRPGLALMLPVIKTTLEGLGITVDDVLTDGSSWDQLDQIMADDDYDLLMWAQNTLPAGDPQWFLNAFFRSTGGNNHAGLNSSAVDAALDALATTTSHQERVTVALAAQNAILDEVPVSNLMSPSWHVGLSGRLASYTPWGSDYYVVRGDLEPVEIVECPTSSPTSSPTEAPGTTANAEVSAAEAGVGPLPAAAIGAVASLWPALM